LEDTSGSAWRIILIWRPAGEQRSSVWEREMATPAEARPIQSLPFAVRDPTLDHARVIREARVHHVLGI
jgi:hypothetical protein